LLNGRGDVTPRHPNVQVAWRFVIGQYAPGQLYEVGVERRSRELDERMAARKVIVPRGQHDADRLPIWWLLALPDDLLHQKLEIRRSCVGAADEAVAEVDDDRQDLPIANVQRAVANVQERVARVGREIAARSVCGRTRRQLYTDDRPVIALFGGIEPGGEVQH